MKPRIKIATATTSDGTVLELYEHDGAHEISIGGASLMGTRQHHSEEALAHFACDTLPPKPTVLIGGLGIGFTLRAALDMLPPDGVAVQVELIDQIVQWNRGPLGHHAGHPLDDPRTKLVVGDVAAVARRYRGKLAAIMLDVDNGSSPMVMTQNAKLYSRAGLRSLTGALAPAGKLAIWSANDDPRLARRLEECGLLVEQKEAHARPGRKGARHCILVGQKAAAPG